MAKKTKISWADATFNPWWGCTKVSAGCDSCYAETFSKRVGENVWGPTAKRRFFGDKHWNEPRRWRDKAKASGESFRVFCASMADICEDRPDLIWPRMRLMGLIQDTPELTWILLTKRPENFNRLFDWRERGTHRPLLWPKNVWAMATVENQEQAEKRIPQLWNVAATVRGISYEPALGPLNLKFSPAYIDWVICGGESGIRARPMSLDWARSVRDQCRRDNIAFFMKQLGGARNKKDRLEDLPADLQIREWPQENVNNLVGRS